MAPKVYIGVGIGGGFLNSVVQTHHAAVSFYGHMREVDSVSSAITTLVNMDDATFQGTVVYCLMMVSVWLPVVVLITRPFGLIGFVPSLGLGAFGTILVSIMDLRYACTILWVHFNATDSLTSFATVLLGMDSATLLGIATYAFLVVATWIPLLQLVRCKARPLEIEVAQHQLT